MRYATATYHRTQQLDESQLLAETRLCPWCGSQELRRLVCLQRDPEVHLQECPQCHASSASRMPTAAALASYYGGYYSGEQYEKSGHKVTLGNPRRMGRHLAQFAAKAGIRGRVRILDFGGGDGTAAAETAVEMLKSGGTDDVEITVVDYSRDQVAAPDRRITLQAVQTLDDLPDGEHDLVIASAVIEHIPDAPSVLERVLSRVRPGGVLYIRTPQVKSFVLLAKALRFGWDFTFPAHVYDLGQAFWEQHFGSAALRERFAVLSSKPSLVEASFTESPLRAGLSLLFKMPWYLLGGIWGFVGGWEIVLRRKNAK